MAQFYSSEMVSGPMEGPIDVSVDKDLHAFVTKAGYKLEAEYVQTLAAKKRPPALMDLADVSASRDSHLSPTAHAHLSYVCAVARAVLLDVDADGRE